VPLEATGIVGNLTAIPYAATGYLNIYATGTNPATSTLNFNEGQVRANNFQLGMSGNAQVTLVASTPVDAIVDVVGYFGSDAPTWTVTLRDEANRLASEYTVPPAGQGSITRLRNHLYLGNLLVATRNSSGGYTYFASDHLGTPRVGTGAEPVTRKFQPFGLEIPGASGGLPIKFAAMERDLSSGNDFDHARYQSSLLGRFLGPDKLQGDPQDPQSWNRYAYAGNNPLAYVDPDGLYKVPSAVSHAASVISGFLPGLGEAQDAIGAVAGYDLVTSERLSTGQRILSGVALLVPFVGGSLLRGGKGGADLIQGAESEVIRGFEVWGTSRIVGGTFERNIVGLFAEKVGRTSPRAFLRELEAQAVAAGAKELRITGKAVINEKLLNLDPRLLGRLGYTVKRIDKDTIVLIKKLAPGA
jgi:RHS repeat-associated protein